MSSALALAEQIAMNAPLAVGAIKEVLRATAHQEIEAAYRTLRSGSVPTYRAMLTSEDAKEGPRAFGEKRPPVWRGV
jgi:crotonobetainyl-CoA hydratase